MHTLIYYITAPIRLFGRSRAFRWLIMAVIVLGGSFVAANWALERFLPGDNGAAQLLAKAPPPPALKTVSSASVVIAPVAISLAAVRDALEATAPRQFSGNGNQTPLSGLLSKADVGIVVTRGPISLSGKPNVLTASVPLTSAVHITGDFVGRTADQAANAVGDLSGKLGDRIGGQLGGLLNGALGKDIGRAVGQVTTKALNQTSNLHSQVTLHARPKLERNWRLDPNLSADLSMGRGSMRVAGVPIDLASQARPLISQGVNEGVQRLQARISNDPFIEKAARAQWTKMCRSIPLGGGKTGLPRLWLEMKPVRAAAAQPQIDAHNMTLTVGVQADTRVTATETKPECPFPKTIELVPPMQNGKLTVGLPIDIPFTMLNTLLEAQLKGHHYPEEKGAPVDVTVRAVHIAAAGDRLLISLKVHAVEKKSWFGFGANATINVWGKPVLDTKTQILRFTDIVLAVQSKAAYGLLSAAARAATPYLTKAIADNAVVDLKPFATDARKKIASTLAEFRNTQPGVRVDAAVNDLRLTGINFDAHTLRVTAAAAGAVKVAVSKLPKL
ncbi:MAG: DUF4403 family protein [Pseudolabrys sp.]|jgi:hypothetical protein